MPRIAIPFLLSLFALFSLPVASSGEAMLQRVNDCPGNAVQYRGRNGAETCHCSARASRDGTVWGTEIFTDDSRICRAAVHDGRISERGGNVRIVFLSGRNSYQGSQRNGVRSQNYGRWQGSFRFAGGDYGGQPGGSGRVEDCPSNATQWRGRRDRQQCQCDARETRSGSVWGTQVYTDDSRICRAAVHAGVIGNRGGVVTLDMRRGQSSYDGSNRNGVRSSDYGRWQGSYVFVDRGGNPGGGDDGGYVPPNVPYPPLPPQSGERVENCPGYGFGLRTIRGSLRCECTRTGVSAGQVYGTNVYSERSAICHAARHAGAIGNRGGVITVIPGGRQSRFRGSSSNGVSTLDAPGADFSFRFGR